VAWYLEHGLALRRRAEAARRKNGATAQPRVRTNAPAPDPQPRTKFVVGKAEALPLADASQDAVTSIFLFHELPPKVRRSAILAKFI
jgi:hypothetical protein